MPDLVVVPFDKGRTDGDNTFNPAIVFPYKEGMTLEDLRKITLDYFAKEFGYEDADNAHELIEEDEGIKVIGGWVLDAKLHDLINNVIIDCGSDSACYAVNRLQKTQVENASTFIVE